MIGGERSLKRKFEFDPNEISLIIGAHLSNRGVELAYDEKLIVSSLVDSATGRLVGLVAEIEKLL